ncbi:hypothetical protein CFIMG_005014RA [Ceratocystis fimbriata CBS 114723]|uniref:Uncharacterized protein n=1 Tax=Ceratocystis fimbriata CBS 114723 TaxID=1035309 RepID=A0A2C5WY61_9PEZI|nr:hypothetical protein CFIMG_005014RA [Ceratocystis fimbriata CBS 114723]
MASDRPNEVIADLSGLNTGNDVNPFTAFIGACSDNAAQLQAAYDSHRTKRNAAQKEKFLTEGTKLSPDLILRQMLKLNVQDERNCLVVWSRPPMHIIDVAWKVQEMIVKGMPDAWEYWLMPTHNMHMTVAEVAFSQPPEVIQAFVRLLRPHTARLARTSYTHRARLVRPLLSMDTTAFALSFVPACNEPFLASQMDTMTAEPPTDEEEGENNRREDTNTGDAYTYHHLRRDVFSRLIDAGIPPTPRYQVPSAHITLGRFIGASDQPAITQADAEQWIRCVDKINTWLRETYWTSEDVHQSAEWIVGQERGLDIRYGPVWYGGGKSLVVGEGF